MSKSTQALELEVQSYRSKSTPTQVAPGNTELAKNLNFSYSEALVAASFAAAAYQHDTATTSFLERMTFSPLSGSASSLEVKNAYAFAGKRETPDGRIQFLISFEGSNTTLSQIKDWIDNVSKYGWSDYYKSLQPLFAEVIHQALTAKSSGKEVELLVTGHSLGGAAASVAMADLFLPKGVNFWPEKSAPLGSSSRIYEQPVLSQWTEADIRGLLADTQLYVFGAPSFLIEPNKLDAWGLVKFGLDLATSFGIIDFFYNFGKNVAGVLNVDRSKIPSLEGFSSQAFQFEHANTSALFGLGVVDPVTALGSEQAGSQVAINLSDANYSRYGGSAFSLHSMEFYVESVARAISGSELTKVNDPSATKSILLPQFSNGTDASDRIINATEGFGLAGNDLLIVNTPGRFTLNGGFGDDTFVLSSYGAEVVINGAAGETTDALFFAVQGTLSFRDEGNDRVITITGPDAQSSTVRIDGDNGYAISLVGILQPNASTPWTVAISPMDPPPGG